ncbi:MAG: lipoyl(octanoyl) transferase LipB [Pseudomonadota bacterium]
MGAIPEAAAGAAVSRSAATGARVRRLGRADYEPVWHAMRDFTLARGTDTGDELWVVEHPPVYTVGLAGRPEHFPTRTDIPLVKVDRGGQITYHGPGQIVVYLLLDLRRLRLSVRPLVGIMEQSVIDLLAARGVAAAAREDAPGVYAGGAKIAALGLRIRNGCCYHGLAFNADMDLTPFRAIDPCGYRGLAVTQARDLGIGDPLGTLAAELVHNLQARVYGNP